MSTRASKRKASVNNKTSVKVRRKEASIAGTEFIVECREKVEPGSVLVFGDNSTGQLGLGPDVAEKSRPAALPDLSDMIGVAAGGMHNVCITADHKVVTFGCNDEGALGRDTSEEGSETVPGLVDLPGKVVQVSAGDSHSSALLENGHVFVWGNFRDIHGSMGLLQSNKIEKKPIQLKSDVRFVRVSSGYHHLVLLGEDRQVYTCGLGEHGQLGRLSARASSRDSRQGLDRLLTPSLVPFRRRPNFGIVDIWAGSNCTFAKDNEGVIYAFGLNNYKQLGADREDINIFHPTVANTFVGKNWVKICTGDHHTVALDDGGGVYTLGRKEYGRLGRGADCPDADKPTKVTVGEEAKCQDVACGTSTSFAVTVEGKLYSWGMGSSQLGLGSGDDNAVVPTLVTGKQLERREVVRVSSGGQHTVILTRQLPA